MAHYHVFKWFGGEWVYHSSPTLGPALTTARLLHMILEDEPREYEYLAW